MSIESVILKRDELIAATGRTGLNLAFPSEFELYVLAFELLNEQGETLKYFIFPTNPSTIDEAQSEITNVKITLGGVTSLSTPRFIPSEITLSGNFGRRFRILLGEDYKEFLGGFKKGKGGLKNGIVDLFDSKIKTGYGCIKVLESIINEARRVDDQGIKTLIFHNLALGNSYIVKPLNIRFSQSQESNMVWNYNLSMKGVAPLSSLYTSKELTDMRHRLILTGYFQTQVNNVVNNLTNILS